MFTETTSKFGILIFHIFQFIEQTEQPYKLNSQVLIEIISNINRLTFLVLKWFKRKTYIRVSINCSDIIYPYVDLKRL